MDVDTGIIVLFHVFPDISLKVRVKARAIIPTGFTPKSPIRVKGKGKVNRGAARPAHTTTAVKGSRKAKARVKVSKTEARASDRG